MNEIQDYRSRFGFRKTPFTREIGVADHFKIPAHEQTTRHLYQAIEERMSAALIGPAGCGKTTLIRGLSAELSQSRYTCAYLKVNDLSKRDFCRELSSVFGLAPSGTYPSLLRRIQERFSKGFCEEGMRWVLILDEAHDFRPEVLGILRILTNFEMDSKLVVSLILAGQRGLDHLLSREMLRDVAGRLAHRARLELLSPRQVEDYVQHRCAVAGATQTPFDADALTALHDLTHGNLRAIDQLAYKALLVAHEAGAECVNTNHITKARGML
jgi:type II secretory pathway predicted ATPase ExeA